MLIRTWRNLRNISKKIDIFIIEKFPLFSSNVTLCHPPPTFLPPFLLSYILSPPLSSVALHNTALHCAALYCTALRCTAPLCNGTSTSISTCALELDAKCREMEASLGLSSGKLSDSWNSLSGGMHGIASHLITSYHFISYRITFLGIYHRISSYHIILYCITSYHIVSYRITFYGITSPRMCSFTVSGESNRHHTSFSRHILASTQINQPREGYRFIMVSRHD